MALSYIGLSAVTNLLHTKARSLWEGVCGKGGIGELTVLSIFYKPKTFQNACYQWVFP